MPAKETGLGNQAMLAKIDKLRELNVGSMIPLPQLVVVGDQSSGKSSVLESLTGFSFPRAAGLCTRYATQITCCRDPIKSVSISIIPRPDADEDLKAKLVGFHRRLDGELENDKLAKIFHEANVTMGIRMTTDEVGSGLGAFSQDILKIEVNGPDQSHLTVIDVPGIFRVPTPGLTTETDITLVENMVKSYMSNSRTIILAVMPCNVDIATQEILKLAQVADPDGVRTMGVLTKPDLATEVATRAAILDLVQGRRSNNLKLGYYIIKNRSADDNKSTLAQRAAAETSFFMAPPWTTISDRCGIASLKGRLRSLLMKISKEEFPHVKSEIAQRLRRCKADLGAMGPARADQSAQRLYLVKLAGRFQAVTQAALNGYYAGEQIFKADPDLKLITRIIMLNEVFSNVFWRRGHLQDFGQPSDDEDAWIENKSRSVPFEVPLTEYRELDDIIQTDDYNCPAPSSDPIMDNIRSVFQSSRGPELGTFGGAILSTVFEQQSGKWERLALSHVSEAIALVHDFIFRLLVKLCPEKQVRDQLWDVLLLEELSKRYREAMNHTRFLLTIERGGKPSTLNHYFNANLQKKRAERLSKPLKRRAIKFPGYEGDYVSVATIDKCTVDKDNTQQVCEDILDTLVSYYKVARKRFVDVICQQVVSYFLLDGEVSPLKAFGPDLVMGLDPEQLEMIAGEDDESKQQRQTLEREIRSLEAALKVLRA